VEIPREAITIEQPVLVKTNAIKHQNPEHVSSIGA
jgi:hypothetical protein